MYQNTKFFCLLCLSVLITIKTYLYIHSDWVVFRQAETFFFDKHFDRAVPLYKEIVNNGFSQPEAFMHLAECYEKSGKSDEAIDLYEILTKKKPEDFWLHLELGGLYARHQRPLLASKAYRHALSLHPDNRMARIFFARSLTALGKFDEAVKEYRIVLGEIKKK